MSTIAQFHQDERAKRRIRRTSRRQLAVVILDPGQLTEAALLWIDGFDSVDIGACLGLHPAAIANAMPEIRAEART